MSIAPSGPSAEDTSWSQQGAVADLGLLALREPSVPVLLDEAATLVRRALNTDFSKVLQLEPDNQLLVLAGSGWPDGVVGHLEISARGDSPAGFALRSQLPVVVPDLFEETRFKSEPALIELGVRSCVNVIVESSSQPFGVLEVDCRAPREFTQSEVTFLQLVANILSGALERQARNAERERFLSLAAHELRSPITSILGFSRRVLRRVSAGTPIDESAIGDLETLHQEAKRLEMTVRQLSELARVGHPLTLDLEPVSIGRLLREVMVDLRGRYPRIEFDEQHAAGEVIVDADASLLEAALVNLLDNAAKYSPPGGRVTAAIEADDARVNVRVRDNCGGLGETKVSRLFEPYYRGSPQHKASGLGVGLYVAHQAAVAMGGDISVTDIPGDGCEFALGLPAASDS